MREIFVFGHKKPDTDSVTASIALANLKRELGMNAKPMILDHINKETEFVLKHFNINIPEYLEDVKLQLKDLNYYKDCFISENSSINNAYKYMKKNNITGIPIVNNDRKIKGLITSKMIGEELINGDFIKIHTSYDNIIEVLDGELVLKFDDEINGNILVAPFKSSNFLTQLQLANNTVMIVGNNQNLIKLAIENKIKLLILVDNLNIKEEYLNTAIKNKVNIIKTHFNTFMVSKLINLSKYAKDLLTENRNISFNENDYYDDFKEKCIRYGYNNYPIVDDKGTCLGLIRVTDIKNVNKKQVILVDHNDCNQSVDGLNEAEILEIVDHHNIGALTTNMPINFRSMTVGSTNSIIYSMYNENNIDISKNIAGIMLSGIISDTLKLTSPTTTEYDIYVAKRLSQISNIDIDSYSNEMFKAGTNLSGKTIKEIIEGDLKLYNVNNKKIAISQVITFNPEEILNKKEDYINSITEMSINKGLELFILCVTDIIKNGSYIFYDKNHEILVSEALSTNNVYQGYFLQNCLSRKKQLVPLIMNVIR